MKAKKVASEKTATGGTGTSHSEGARAESASDAEPQPEASTQGGSMPSPRELSMKSKKVESDPQQRKNRTATCSSRDAETVGQQRGRPQSRTGGKPDAPRSDA
jgi:hypothetical protein